MAITLPSPAPDAPPLLLARRAVRRMKTTLFHYRHAARIALLGQFESLGDNCEFASLQKASGVDLPGLFKWTSTTAAGLAETLDKDLAGVDDIANLQILSHAGNPEYVLYHRLHQSSSHTFALIGSDDPDKVLQRQHRRLILLKRKFLEDVREGRRIYVFRSLRPVSEDDMSALNRALRRKGPNTLLWVRPAASPATVGQVTRGAEGMLVADIDTLAAYDDGMNPASRHWLPILRRARNLVRAGASPVPHELAA